MPLNETLSPKQSRAVASLLSASTTEKAAESAGISRTQLWRWLDEPAFKTALKQAQSEAIDAAVRRLASSSGEALDVLLEVMRDTLTPAGVRVRAAATVLEQLIKLKEFNDLEARIAALEALAN